jgi:hypothetical protein
MEEVSILAERYELLSISLASDASFFGTSRMRTFSNVLILHYCCGCAFSSSKITEIQISCCCCIDCPVVDILLACQFLLPQSLNILIESTKYGYEILIS